MSNSIWIFVLEIIRNNHEWSIEFEFGYIIVDAVARMVQQIAKRWSGGGVEENQGEDVSTRPLSHQWGSLPLGPFCEA